MNARPLTMAIVCSLLTGLVNAAELGDEIARPNVLLIFVDDLNCELGTYGNSIVESPNIDALARRGMQFDRAYCANPVCMPSRTAILTGLRSETTKTLNNNAGCFRQNVPDAVTMPQLFHRNGYTMATVGKTFYSHGSDDAETDKILPRLSMRPARWPGIDDLLIDENERVAIRQELRPRQRTYWGPVDGADADMPDGQVALAAAKFLTGAPSGHRRIET